MSKRRRFTEVFRRKPTKKQDFKNAFKSSSAITTRPSISVTPFLSIYNITQKERLEYNKKRGFSPEDVNWEIICKVRPQWSGTDDIWAIANDKAEYQCTHYSLGENPIFVLMKSFMPNYILTEYRKVRDADEFQIYYYKDLIKTTPVETSSKWWLAMDKSSRRIVGISS